ncbi:MAG: hypothetical protein JWQ73_1304 [Variovorax sp.]|nr:hypothetical protein [Variovorax sp.]
MKNKLLKLGVPLVAALVLTACGGGGGGGGYVPIVTAPPAQNPTPVADAYDTFVAYVKQLVASTSETDAPADVSKFDPPPTSETKDPVATQ